MDPTQNQPTIIKSFKYNSPKPQPMFSVVESPLHYNSSFEHHDISFSSYLKPKDTTSPNNPATKNENGDNPPIDDTEISIFDAQKYFSETNDPIKVQQQQHDVHSIPRMSSVSSVDGHGRNFRTRSFHAMPTASSEASWNSQTGLLANPPGSNGVSLRNLNFHDQDKKRSFMSRKWSFGRKSCCSGKKSVQVKDKLSDSSENNSNNSRPNYLYTKTEKPPVCSTILSQRSALAKSSPENEFLAENDFSIEDLPRQRRVSASGRPFGDVGGGFSFPVLKPSIPTTTKIIAKTIINNPLEADPPRDSLDVFQPVHENSRHPSLDNPVMKHFNPGSPITRATNTEDDAGSDASSDLFEIESFSTQTTSYPMYRRRDSLDEATTFNARRFNGARRSLDEPPTPSIAATECYAPSEVSVDWSVTTAEGFDRASVSNFSSVSEIGNMALMRRRQEEYSGGGDRGGGRVRKGNGGLLMLSCRQEKAVSVGPKPTKCVAEGPGQALMFPVHVGGRPPRSGSSSSNNNNSNTGMGRLSLAFAA